MKRRSSFDDFRVTGFIKPGERGTARIDLAEAGVSDIFSTPPNSVRLGDKATRLIVGRELMMSDTRDEWRDHIGAINNARGRVLIHGLGLGCYLKAVLAKPEVEHVDVVEINPDVLALVGPYFRGDSRVNLIQGDAFELKWQPGTRWNTVWHDIWPTMCVDDLRQHERLLRSYGNRCDWQGAWRHEWLRARR